MNFKYIVNKAIELLITQKISELPIEPLKIQIKNVIITSYRNYAEKTNISESDLMQDGELIDAYTVSKNGKHIILYNDRIYEPRKRFSIFHEIGHIVLEHKKQSEDNELEADFFASQFILPNILVKEIYMRGYTLNKNAIVSIFNVSNAVAEKRINFINKYPDISNEYDDAIITLFQNYLNKNFPNRNIYDDCEEKEKLRNKWRESY